jgi:hypothetical protein
MDQQNALYQQALRQSNGLEDPRFTSQGFLSQQSLHPFAAGNPLSLPTGKFLGYPGAAAGMPSAGLGSGMPDLSSIMDQNRAAINQTYLQMLQDEATAAVTTRLRGSGGMPGSPQQDGSGRGLSDGRRY